MVQGLLSKLNDRLSLNRRATRKIYAIKFASSTIVCVSMFFGLVFWADSTSTTPGEINDQLSPVLMYLVISIPVLFACHLTLLAVQRLNDLGLPRVLAGVFLAVLEPYFRLVRDETNYAAQVFWRMYWQEIAIFYTLALLYLLLAKGRMQPEHPIDNADVPAVLGSNSQLFQFFSDRRFLRFSAVSIALSFVIVFISANHLFWYMNLQRFFILFGIVAGIPIACISVGFWMCQRQSDNGVNPISEVNSATKFDYSKELKMTWVPTAVLAVVIGTLIQGNGGYFGAGWLFFVSWLPAISILSVIQICVLNVPKPNSKGDAKESKLGLQLATFKFLLVLLGGVFALTLLGLLVTTILAEASNGASFLVFIMIILPIAGVLTVILLAAATLTLAIKSRRFLIVLIVAPLSIVVLLVLLGNLYINDRGTLILERRESSGVVVYQRELWPAGSTRYTERVGAEKYKPVSYSHGTVWKIAEKQKQSHITWFERLLGVRATGVLHRADGPAKILYGNDGQVLFEEWYKNGILHRTDGPAQRSFYMDGSLKSEKWIRNGEAFGRDTPIEIQYHENGNIRLEKWSSLGVSSDEAPPTIIAYYSDGSVRKKSWMLDGMYHRWNGPAVIFYHGSGAKKSETYRRFGKRHREDGPAYIAYDESGAVLEERWYLEGKKVSAPSVIK